MNKSPSHWSQRSRRWEPSSLVWHRANPISQMDMELAHCSSIQRNSRTCWWHFHSISLHSISSSNRYHVCSSIHGIFDDSSRTHIQRMEFSLLVHAPRELRTHMALVADFGSATARLADWVKVPPPLTERALETSKSSSRQVSLRRPSSATIVSQFQLS